MEITSFRHFFLSILLCALSLPWQIQATTPAPQQEPISQTEDEMVPIGPVLKALVAITMLQLYYVGTSRHGQEKLLDQLKPENLALNAASEFSFYFLMTLIHEGGHALVARYLNNDPINIHVGGNGTNKFEKPLFSSKHFTLDGLSPLEGMTIYRLSTEMSDKLLFVEYLQDCQKNNIPLTGISVQDFEQFKTNFITTPAYQKLLKKLNNNQSTENAILAAGGIAALSANTLIKIIHSLAKSYQTNTALTQALKDSCEATFSIDKIVLNQVLSAFLPISSKSDGAKLWRNIAGVPENVLEHCYQVAPYVDMLGECYLACKDPRAQNAKLPDKLMIGFINYLLRGYLRFHA